mgnify:CR=1 FL=1
MLSRISTNDYNTPQKLDKAIRWMIKSVCTQKEEKQDDKKETDA